MTFRVLCRKILIAKYAPNGPNSAENTRVRSEVRREFLRAAFLSWAKIKKTTRFTAHRKMRERVKTAIDIIILSRCYSSLTNNRRDYHKDPCIGGCIIRVQEILLIKVEGQGFTKSTGDDKILF